MKSTSKRILFILLALAFLLAAVIVYSTLVRPTYANVVELRARVASQSQALQRYQKTLQDVQALLAQLSDSSRTQRQASLMLPLEKDGGYFIGQLIGLGRINNLQAESLGTQIAPTQPAQSSVIKSVGKMKAEMKLSGGYGDFKAFLRQVEKNLLITDVSSIRVEGSLQGTSQSLDYTLSALSYYQAQ